MKDDNLLLFIEPEGEPSKNPVIDDITLKMTKALRSGIPGGEIEKGIVQRRESKPSYMIIPMPWNEKYDFIINSGWMGVHTCSCGVNSKSNNYLILSGDIVNFLCVHYLAFHREEIPEWQIEVVKKMKLWERETISPTDKELAWPPRKKEDKKPMTRAEYLGSLGKK